MTTQSDQRAPRDEPVGSNKASVWFQSASGWGPDHAECETIYVRPALPLTWRRIDPAFGEECDELGRDADRRVMEGVRRRALEGQAPSQALAFRATRGFARAVESSGRMNDPEPLPPGVAAAMLEAGLSSFEAY